MSKGALIFLFFAFFSLNGLAQTSDKRQFKVHFQTDKYILDSTAVNKLKTFFNGIAIMDIESIVCVGHTDYRADSIYNIQLSQKRVFFVQQYLYSLGIPEHVISAAYFGENKPAQPNNSAEHMAQNRRVEIEVTLKPLWHRIQVLKRE